VDNRTIAQSLLQYARHLRERGENLYRVRAYRRAAETVLGLDQPLSQLIATRGRRGLEVLPAVGPHLAYTIHELVRTGQFRTMSSDEPWAPPGGASVPVLLDSQPKRSA
jgi:DNA polymerase (family 10)